MTSWIPQRIVLVAVLAFVTSSGAQEGLKKIDANVLRSAGTPADALAGSWLTYGLSQSETRFSPLHQIDTTNVSRLGLSWTYVAGAGGGNQEATPLVWGDTIYGITTWSVVFALDARTGQERWRWDPEVNQDAVRPKICCGAVNRGLAIYDGRIFAPIIDGRLVALDALTGKVRWESRVAYPQEWFSLTMAPRIANGKVLIGAAGGDHPTRGFFDAYDAATGLRAWRFYTVPGDPAGPGENEAMRKAAKTWGGDFYKMGGGGAVWDGMAYDPDLDLVYVGTGNAEPWVQKFRGVQGLDNLYTCSILAVRVSTGELKWHYQVVPNDNWDYDSVQQMTLADLTIEGRPRKVLMQASKNGFFYVLDRTTGEFLPRRRSHKSTGLTASTSPAVRKSIPKRFMAKMRSRFFRQRAAHITGRLCLTIRAQVLSIFRRLMQVGLMRPATKLSPLPPDIPGWRVDSCRRNQIPCR